MGAQGMSRRKRTGGRPPLGADKRVRLGTVWVRPDVLEALRALAGGQRLGAWVSRTLERMVDGKGPEKAPEGVAEPVPGCKACATRARRGLPGQCPDHANERARRGRPGACEHAGACRSASCACACDDCPAPHERVSEPTAAPPQGPRVPEHPVGGPVPAGAKVVQTEKFGRQLAQARRRCRNETCRGPLDLKDVCWDCQLYCPVRPDEPEAPDLTDEAASL